MLRLSVWRCIICFDAVGWASGRASGLKKLSYWGAGVVICLEQGADLHMAQLMPLPLIVSCFSKIHIGFTLEFADGLNLVICNTLFTKQEAKLVTYVAGPVKSTVDYIMVRQEDKDKIRNVKVITSEECVPKHKLLVMDMWFKATKRRR